MQDIVKYFTKANLKLALTDKPIANIGTGGRDIFQMTIDAGKPERFRLFRGKDTDIRVLDYCPTKEQVLLFVKEPKRRFTETHYDYSQAKNVTTERVTNENIRKYLMGMDERHLFISELPDRKINKIEDAVRALKPFDIKDRKKRKDQKIFRQGEWFFVTATAEELEDINKNIKLVMHKEAIPNLDRRFGKAHTAENLLVIKDKIFVKGKIRHADHKTKEFFNWQRVFRNTEKINTNTIGWID